MSGVVHPVGPKPQSVYWRRRAVFLLAIVLTLFIIGRSIFGGSDSKSSAFPVGSNSPTAEASQSPSVSASASASTESGATATASSEPTDAVDPITLQSASPIATKTQPADACTDSEISVRVSMPKRLVKAGAGSDLLMTVTNTSDRTCRRDVGSGANEVSIISGPAHVWSTDDCSPGSESNYVKLKPNQSWSVKVVWNGKLSATNCQVLSTAQYGAYWAHARNGAELSTGVRFVVQ